MLKLRILLLRDCLYFIILFISLVYFFIFTKIIKYESKYDGITEGTFKIVNINSKDYGIELILKGKEKVKAYYYLEDYEKELFFETYDIGDKVFISFQDTVIKNSTLENTFDYKKYLYNKRIYKVVSITDIKLISKNKNIFYKLRDFLLDRTMLLKKSYPYVNSLLFGNNIISKSIKNTYQSNGISHLFAISGLHISLFVSLISFVLKKLKIKENKRYFIVILFLLFYMFLANFQVSLIRASVFNILIIINKVFYFNIKPTNVLILTLSIIIFINPFFIYDIGFQYSFLISSFLVISSNYINGFKGFFIKLLVVSFISFLVSLPISINNIHEVNFLSILLNLFYVPFLSYVILPLCLISYVFPFLDRILYIFILIMECSSKFFSNIKVFKVIFANMPFVLILIYYFLLFFKIKFSKKKYNFFIFLFIVFLYFRPFISSDYYLLIDVDQGDSSLLHISNKTIVIDTGGDYNDNTSYSLNKLIPYFKSKGIRKIDYLILTHGDNDHMGDAIDLVNNFKVEKVIFNCGEFNELEKELIKVLDKKKIKYYSCIKELNIDKNKLYFLNNKDYGNENDNSSIIYTKLNNHKFLFMGDAGIEVEEDLIKKYNLQDIDVLKVGHHGSKTSSSIEFINEINPKYSIISVGKNNRYGHPNKEVLASLKESKIYRTDEDGSIMFKIKNNKLKIKTCSP